MEIFVACSSLLGTDQSALKFQFINKHACVCSVIKFNDKKWDADYSICSFPFNLWSFNWWQSILNRGYKMRLFLHPKSIKSYSQHVKLGTTNKVCILLISRYTRAFKIVSSSSTKPNLVNKLLKKGSWKPNWSITSETKRKDTKLIV